MSKKIVILTICIFILASLPLSSMRVMGDPLFDNTPVLGYEFLDNNSILHMWNTYNDYYFNVSNGIQFTNHYNEYWSHNVLMLGYYFNENWNLIYRTDALSGFNKDIVGITNVSINATIWKDLSYGVYDFRLAIRYHLGVNDIDLTIIPYIKNLGTEIPYVLGFGWELKDIQINATEENDYITVNRTSYYLDQTLNNTYTNLSFPIHNASGNITGWTAPFFEIAEDITSSTSKYLYLIWDKDLNYLLRVKNRTGQYNAPVTLFIRVGSLGVGQEKFTELQWLDADTVEYYFDDYDVATAWATNPQLMVDGFTGNYAETNQEGDMEMCDENTCPGTDLGTISKVELQAYGYTADVGDDALLDWAGQGGPRMWTTSPGYGLGWSDVTAGDPAWTWADVVNMNVLVICSTRGGNVYCSQVEIRVTYTTAPANTAPTQSAQNIWNATTKVEKSLNATGVDLYPTCFNITISDAEGDDMNITIFTNESGSWTTVNQTSGSGLSNGTYSFINASWVDGFDTKYWINFSVTDGTDWTNETFNFTTASAVLHIDINRSSCAFGLVQPDTIVYSNGTGEYTFRIFNNGTCAVDIDINATNGTASGFSDWVLSSGNGVNLTKMEIYNDTTNWHQVNLTKDTWYDNLIKSTNITANLRITTPTVFYTGKQRTFNVYMSVTIH